MLRTYLRRAYPTHEVEVEFRTIDLGDAKFKTNDDGNEYMSYPNCSAVNSENWRYAHVYESRWGGQSRTMGNVRFYGMVSDGGGSSAAVRRCREEPHRGQRVSLQQVIGTPMAAMVIGMALMKSPTPMVAAMLSSAEQRGALPYPYTNGRISEDFIGPDAFHRVRYSNIVKSSTPIGPT